MRLLGLPVETLLSILEVFAFVGAVSLILALTSLFQRRLRRLFTVVFVSAMTFSALGWVVGYNMTNSREPAVTAVLPAVLTLVAGILAYILGSKGMVSRYLVCMATLGFSLCLYVAGFSGARARFEFENTLGHPAYLHQRLADLEMSRQVLATEKLMFEGKFRQIRDALAAQYGVDLSDLKSLPGDDVQAEKTTTGEKAPSKKPK